MRKIDKKLNINRVNLLAEQRYLVSKGLINEGPITDIDGVTNDLLKDYIYAYNNGKDLGMVDAKIYDLIKKTLSVHGSEPEIKKQMYLTMSEKLKNTNIPKLQSFGQTYNMIGRSFET